MVISKYFSSFSAGIFGVDIHWKRLAEVRLVGVCSISFRGEAREVAVLLLSWIFFLFSLIATFVMLLLHLHLCLLEL